MKIFIYKTLFVFICLFLLYKFTIDAKISEYEKKFELLQSDYGREILREKIIDLPVRYYERVQGVSKMGKRFFNFLNIMKVC